MPVNLKVLQSQWEAAFERYRLAVRQYGSGSSESREQWQRANSALDDVVKAAQKSRTSKVKAAA